MSALGIGTNIFLSIGMLLLLIGAIWLLVLLITGNSVYSVPLWFIGISVIVFVIGLMIVLSSYSEKMKKMKKEKVEIEVDSDVETTYIPKDNKKYN